MEGKQSRLSLFHHQPLLPLSLIGGSITGISKHLPLLTIAVFSITALTRGTPHSHSHALQIRQRLRRLNQIRQTIRAHAVSVSPPPARGGRIDPQRRRPVPRRHRRQKRHRPLDCIKLLMHTHDVLVGQESAKKAIGLIEA
ncbi:uncharacterized protein LOC109814945 [Cajanus cajan]|uniref:uncharacterized protein LOC109814945 n=1 Tax=Cajanus cajan TaxID=3821 RepID=UPI00098DA156|nr:uncharacterized protein LOC109814945 [Cajanus cajan]